MKTKIPKENKKSPSFLHQVAHVAVDGDGQEVGGGAKVEGVDDPLGLHVVHHELDPFLEKKGGRV